MVERTDSGGFGLVSDSAYGLLAVVRLNSSYSSSASSSCSSSERFSSDAYC